MIFAFAGAVLSGAAAGWLAQTFALSSAERRLDERRQRDKARERLETRRAEQISCFEEYLAVSSALLAASADSDRIERLYFAEASRLAAAERLAERRGAALHARVFRLFDAELAADVVRALRQAATARYRADLQAAERSVRELDQKCQDGMLAGIQASARELGDKTRYPAGTAAVLPARAALSEPRGELHSAPAVQSSGPLPESWLRCSACASGMPPHFDWCPQCGQRKSSARASGRAAETMALFTGPVSSLPPVLFDGDAVESMLAEQLHETPVPDPLLRFPAPAALPEATLTAHTNGNDNGIVEPEALESALSGDDAEDEKYRSRQPPPPSIPPRWSVVLTNGESQQMTLEELSSLIQEGRVAPGTLVRKEGMVSYAEIDRFAELNPNPDAATAAEN